MKPYLFFKVDKFTNLYKIKIVAMTDTWHVNLIPI